MKILAKTSIWTWDGRIGRLSYFVNYWLFLSSLSMLLSSLVQLAFATIPTLQLALIAVLNLVFLVIGCNGMFKRMHDYGVSAVPECLKWWGIPFVLLIAGMLMLGLCGVSPSTKIVGGGLVILAVVMGLVFPFYVLLRPGESEPNKYGESEIKVQSTQAKVVLTILFFITSFMLALVNAYIKS